MKPLYLAHDDTRARQAQPLYRLQPGTWLPGDALERRRALENTRTEARDIGRGEGLVDVTRATIATLAHAEILAAKRLEASHTDALKLAFALAERILQSTLEREPERFTALIENALYTFPTSNSLQIHAGPSAHAALSAHLQALETAITGTQLELICLNEAPPWAARITSPAGHLDLGIEAQLQRMAQTLNLPTSPAATCDRTQGSSPSSVISIK